jgi:hypothetical protein
MFIGERHVNDPKHFHYYQVFNYIKLSQAIVLEIKILLSMDFDYVRVSVAAHVAKLTPWS